MVPEEGVEGARAPGIDLDLDTSARALDAAAAAGRFDVVAQLARELEARRLAREPNVLKLPSRNGKR
jgi:hypothetical protein